MKITEGLALLPNGGVNSKKNNIDQTLTDVNTSFGESLSQAIADVSNLQSEAGKAVSKLATGQTADLHDVMIAVEKAKTSFDLLMEVRNKTIEAYREIMRMQV